MAEYQKNYATGRMVVKWVTIFGWVVVGIGVLVAVSAMGVTSQFNSGIMSILLSASAGIGVVFGGLVTIMLAQLNEAVFDGSDINLELLRLQKAGQSESKTNLSDRKTEDTQRDTNDETETNYKGFYIKKAEHGFTVNGKNFTNITDVKNYIDSL